MTFLYLMRIFDLNLIGAIVALIVMAIMLLIDTAVAVMAICFIENVIAKFSKK